MMDSISFFLFIFKEMVLKFLIKSHSLLIYSVSCPSPCNQKLLTNFQNEKYRGCKGIRVIYSLQNLVKIS